MTFGVDGALVEQSFQAVFYYKKKEFTAELKNGQLLIPPELAGLQLVDEVRFKSEKYDLRFRYFIPVNRPDSEWVLGVDTKPFDPDNMVDGASYSDVDYIQYLKNRKKGSKGWGFHIIPVRGDKN